MAVRQLPGTGDVSGDVSSRTVRIEYQSSVTAAETIRVALANIGFDPA